MKKDCYGKWNCTREVREICKDNNKCRVKFSNDDGVCDCEYKYMCLPLRQQAYNFDIINRVYGEEDIESCPFYQLISRAELEL